jgi:hypothetical protein
MKKGTVKKPLGKKLVGYKTLRVDNMLFLTINLYDPQELQIEKEIFRKEYYGQMEDIPDCLAFAMAMKEESRRGALYQVYNNQLFVEGKSEFYILDVKGKFLKKIMIPFEDAEFLQAYPYTISNEKCYQLIANPDTEEWELHINEV